MRSRTQAKKNKEIKIGRGKKWVRVVEDRVFVRVIIAGKSLVSFLFTDKRGELRFFCKRRVYGTRVGVSAHSYQAIFAQALVAIRQRRSGDWPTLKESRTRFTTFVAATEPRD